MQAYCDSRYHCVRRKTHEVFVGNVGVGGSNPIRIQSMTTTNTQDVAGTVTQARALIEAGCEIVRVTAPNIKAAKALKDIRKQLNMDGFSDIPLVADIHFLPNAAMEAVEHVEKVRVNPGNYADKKKFAVLEYSDSAYNQELERLHEAFTPLVLRSKELGRSLRIGTNHGSLSDRIMNRFGDTPIGMAESALEFIRIAESHGFKDIILSMKASNPKVMIQAYRLVVDMMNAEGMTYPLHLGVTEAGDGEDGRIKSAVGIGSLLYDGLGDTIRVSLTEDPVYEIPVAQSLVDKTHLPWESRGEELAVDPTLPDVDAFNYQRRETSTVHFAQQTVSSTEVPRVWINAAYWAGNPALIRQHLNKPAWKEEDTPLEGIVLPVDSCEQLIQYAELADSIKSKSITCSLLLENLSEDVAIADFPTALLALKSQLNLVLKCSSDKQPAMEAWVKLAQNSGCGITFDITAAALLEQSDYFKSLNHSPILFTTNANQGMHGIGAYRALAGALQKLGITHPIWIRNRANSFSDQQPGFIDDLLNSAILSGSLLCDGLGDLISIETVEDPHKALQLAYNVLQGAGARISKTEYVACPSCGRTLFDLQSTTQRIRSQTGHLKGVKIAVMGCIVNGPGEMADADFGYVGGAPGKVNLYVGKECVKYHIPADDADRQLIELIKEHNKWSEPA